MSNVIKLIVSMTIWGSLGVFVKSIPLESFELAFLRAIIACAFLGIIFVRNHYKEKKNEKDINMENKKSTKSLLLLIVSGICISFNWAFLFESYKYTTVSNAILSYYFAPVIVVFLSPILLKEKFTSKTAISVLVALGGLFIILNNQVSASSENFNHTRGITMGLVAACFYAAIVMLNRYTQDFNDYERTFIQLFTASIVLTPFIIYRDVLVIEDMKTLGLIIVLGIVHTGIAYCLYFSAIKNLKVQTTALLSYVDPISSIAFSIIFLREPLSIYQVIGGSIILIAAFVGDRKPKQKEENIVEG